MSAEKVLVVMTDGTRCRVLEIEKSDKEKVLAVFVKSSSIDTLTEELQASGVPFEIVEECAECAQCAGKELKQ